MTAEQVAYEEHQNALEDDAILRRQWEHETEQHRKRGATMRVNDIFPSKYLKADDLNGRTVAVLIERVTQEELGNDVKAIVYFRGKQKGLVLNKTNGNIIANRYGEETDDWNGCEIELYQTEVSFQGKMVDAIRVRAPKPPPPAQPEEGEITDGEVPF